MVQAGVPLTERPFQLLGEKLGQSERTVIDELEALSAEKILREISAVLEGSALGYESALVAGSIPETRLETTVEVVNAHPTVSHNYLRNHHYNLWFTIAVPPGMGTEHHGAPPVSSSDAGWSARSTYSSSPCRVPSARKSASA